MQLIRSKWDEILYECKTVATALGDISSTFPSTRIRKNKRFPDDENQEDDPADEETTFKNKTFFVIIDSVIAGISKRFDAMKNLNETFSFLWQFTTMNENVIQNAADIFVKKYESDVSTELCEEIIHLKNIYKANFEADLPPFHLLNKIVSLNLETIFPNVCVALRLFCTIPATVASGERSFSALARVKNFHRSCSTQERVSGLATLCIEAPLARQLNFEAIINNFSTQKARKAFL